MLESVPSPGLTRAEGDPLSARYAEALGPVRRIRPGQISNISLGIIDLIYPPHWQPYLTQDLGKTTDVDVYLNRQVVPGRFLSLHDEVKNFPLQQWGRNAVLVASSALVLLLLLIYIPLNLPLTLSMAWLQGAQKWK